MVLAKTRGAAEPVNSNPVEVVGVRFFLYVRGYARACVLLHVQTDLLLRRDLDSVCVCVYTHLAYTANNMMNVK